MSQPEWEFVANLGDVHPLDYGGMFLYRDKTGVYDPELEILTPVEETDDNDQYEVHRFTLEACTWTPHPEDGEMILSDNKFHPLLDAWFAQRESKRKERPQDTCYFKDLAAFGATTVENLAKQFTSPYLHERSLAWILVGDLHGWNELDNYSLQLTKAEVWQRYKQGELGEDPPKPMTLLDVLNEIHEALGYNGKDLSLTGREPGPLGTKAILRNKETGQRWELTVKEVE